MRAIIVDDHPLARMAFKNLLESEGISVIGEAANGAEALLQVTQQQPDVVIVDVDIPIISGIEVVEKLRKQQFHQIIIVVSAKNELFYGKHSADAGANAFISKNEDMTNIIAAVHAAQNGYSYFSFRLNGFIGSLSSEQEMLLSLSSQESNVMRFLLSGENNMQIAAAMFISNKTVSTYKSRLMEKLCCSSLADLFAFANRNELG
ncbi:acid-sensing system DNA-binding response regulator EvgA [Serratia fonticola]|uniref:acid-sensing system DNA-binding response regulator EvgA n=1 Tax=Serratia fonticola TaxID=47917 RepID=UPI0011C07AD2|nr:acid-sensing system DNA-binding response regulator EvgA [Serratia fonticola]